MTREDMARACEDGWQPIETGPTTGKPVLLWWTTRGASSGYFHADSDGIGWRGDMDMCVPKDQHHCTHWMPLPAPPVAPKAVTP